MKKFNMTTPEGTKDILFEECIARREVEETVKNIFTAHAYNEVISPGFEFFDVFDLGEFAIPQYEMYKSSDNKGRIVAFRPDLTLPIARMAATRLKNHTLPLRLFYNQPIYRNRAELSGRSDECTQAGIELLGAKGLMADLEVISIAVDAINSFGINFRFELGHAELFRILVSKLGVSDSCREEIRSTIESKNYAALNDILNTLEQSVYTKAIAKLPRLFGGEEVFEKAAQYCQDEEYMQTLNYLKTIYNSICKLGLSDNIMVDLSLVQRNDYYSGVVFSAYAEGHGGAVLIGGRYDNLLEKFNTPMPAVGFAVEVDALAEIICDNKTIKKSDIIVFAQEGKEIDVQIKINELVKQGYICETSFMKTVEETKEYAKEKGIEKIIIIGEEVSL